MKIVRSSGNAFGKRLVFEEAEFDQIALQELRDSGFLPSEPAAIRVDRFVESRFKCPVDYQNLGESALGAAVFNRDGSVRAIVVSSRLASETADKLFRSTVAHEAGHGLLHASLFLQDAGQAQFQVDNVDLEGSRILCRASDIKPGQKKGYDGRWWEYQANRMIGSLSIPRPLLVKTVADYVERALVTGNEYLQPSRRNQAAADVARIFYVNPIVARIRLDEVYPPENGQEFF